MYCDDSDMKIVGETKADAPAYPEEALTEAQQNGNLDKARTLGARLASSVLQQTADTPRRILLSFAAVVGMDGGLPAGPTAHTARNAFYDALADFYDTLRDSGAFSFYYLCLQEGSDVAQKVGITFAALCGDPAAAAEGQTLYAAFLETVQQEITTLTFL